ncbi:Iron-sulfur cluster co-chaperone protein [Nymphaea thermarum]|nr:Iron-sulfur cluster co-chaperone protein [Nymphaea thermarum]
MMASRRLVSPAFLRFRRCSCRLSFIPSTGIEPKLDLGDASSKETFSCDGYKDFRLVSHFSTNVRFPRRDFSSEAMESCWSCGASSPFLYCDSCGSIQPVDPSVDYFQIFGMEKSFDVEGHRLEARYKDWQKKLHPDLVHTKSEKEKAYAAEQSARVIEAYRTLTKPLTRASYLLQLEGVHVDQEKTISDPELLMEAMEIRESVDEATDAKSLNHVKSQIDSKLEHWRNLFRNAFRSRDFEDAVNSIQRMTYYERAVEEIVKKL